MKTGAYCAVFGMRAKMELQYRGAVLGGVVCQVFFGLILVSLYRALYRSRPQALPLETVVSYVWLQQAFFRMLLSSDNDLADKIRTGDIAYDLCRPVDMYWFYYARIMAQKLVGSLLRGVPMLAFALLLPKGWGLMPPASPAALLCAAASLAMGLMCVSAMENITMGITMRTLDPRGIQALLNLLMTLMAGNVLPLTLFPDAWQRVLFLLPWTQMLDAPIRLYTGVRETAAAAGVLGVQILWTAVLMLLGTELWKRNRKKLVLQGG